MLTPEEFMIPQYAVVGLYPDCPFTLHEVLKLRLYPHNGGVYGFERDGLPGIWDEAYLRQFPNIFKQVEWWWDRVELPIYLKEAHTHIQKVFQVHGYKYGTTPDKQDIPVVYLVGNEDQALDICRFEPASEAEYLSQFTLE